jgi:hypothetical protein
VALRNDAPFPLEAVRDLLGIVRALYTVAKESGAGRAELARIARVGKDLSEAIEIAVATRPGTVGHTAALGRAEEATRRVGDLVDALTPAEPLVQAARARVTGTAVALRRKRPER